MRTARLAVAAVEAALIPFGIAFATGAVAAWHYGHRSPLCAVIRQKSAPVVGCDYGYRAPSQAFVK